MIIVGLMGLVEAGFIVHSLVYVIFASVIIFLGLERLNG